MSNNPKRKQDFQIESIKTPEGSVPTVESFHKVVDGLFGEVLDTRKDIAKLIPNLEKELNNLREILAQQMVLFEIVNTNILKLEKEMKEQAKSISKIQKETEGVKRSTFTEAELTEESKRAIAKVIQSEVEESVKPILTNLSQLKNDLTQSKDDTTKALGTGLNNIKDQIGDLSSKLELQLLEILETMNHEPEKSTKSSVVKKKLMS